tara:strand:+ start:4344 stop:4547 length:204 start_codon:yes stop_codon:yes gene_type:complete
MKKLITLSLILLLTNCAGGNVAKIKFGKKCTLADGNNLQESSFVWFVSKEALGDFDKRINKKNCLKS